MGESVCSWRLGDSGWRGSGRAVATDDYIPTVKIRNKKYDRSHEEVLQGVLPRFEHNSIKNMKAKNKEPDLLNEFNMYEGMNVNTLTDRQPESTMHTVWVIAEKEKDGNIIRKDRLCEKVL